MPEEGEIRYSEGRWLIYDLGQWKGLEAVHPDLAQLLDSYDDTDPEIIADIIDEWSAGVGIEVPREAATPTGPVAVPQPITTAEKQQLGAHLDYAQSGTSQGGDAHKPFWWNDQLESGFKPWAEMGKDEFGQFKTRQLASDLRDAKTYAEAFGIETTKPKEQTAGSLSQQIASAVAKGDNAEANRLRQIQVQLERQGKEQKVQLPPGSLVPGESVGGPPGSWFIQQPNGTLSPWTPTRENIPSVDQQIDRFILEGDFDSALALDGIRDQITGRNQDGLSVSDATRLVMGVAQTPQEASNWLDALLPGRRQTGPFPPPSTYLKPEQYQPSRTQPGPFAQPSMIPLQTARQLQPNNFPTPGPTSSDQEGFIAGQGPFAAGGPFGGGVPFENIPDEQLSPDELRQKQKAQTRRATTNVPFFAAPPAKAPVGLQYNQAGEPISGPFGSSLLPPPVPNELTDTRYVDQSLAGQRAALASLRDRMPGEDFQALLQQAASGQQVSPTSFPGPFIPRGLAREFIYQSPEAARRFDIQAGTNALQAALAGGQSEANVYKRWNQAGGSVNVFQGQPALNPFEQALFDINKRRRKSQPTEFAEPTRVRFA